MCTLFSPLKKTKNKKSLYNESVHTLIDFRNPKYSTFIYFVSQVWATLLSELNKASRSILSIFVDCVTTSRE